MSKKPFTYISLFSCAGVGCYGFKQAGFECVATNELSPRRLVIQKYNHKCSRDEGYICGDITLDSTKQQIFDEITWWKENRYVTEIDVVIATPPCQGMSIFNHKKNDRDIERNSLVIESLNIVKRIQPKFFVFENVPAFMDTECIIEEGKRCSIGEAHQLILGDDYSYYADTINFKYYGSNSSRTRTLVIGVRKNLVQYISPVELFPDRREEHTLREIIGDLPSLSIMGEIFEDDIYHSFRSYPEYMRSWISDLGEGESAFDNDDPLKCPYKIGKDGSIIQNVNKTRDKYKRQVWDKPALSVHTRNDQLASQNTIHPVDDRVFSIRELMRMMTIPNDFEWSGTPYSELNALPSKKKQEFLKKEETNIRQCIGEAVPTEIFKSIADNIYAFLSVKHYSDGYIRTIIKKYSLNNVDMLLEYIQARGAFRTKDKGLSVSTLSRVAELSNNARVENAAYYTGKDTLTEVFQHLPAFGKDEIRVLEPAVGSGNFIPFLIKKYAYAKAVIIDVMDTDSDALRILKSLLLLQTIPSNVKINILQDDFITHDFTGIHYDLIIGNPPYLKLSTKSPNLAVYRELLNDDTGNNLAGFFVSKSLNMADYVALILPKNILCNTEYQITRMKTAKKRIEAIIDFGETGFRGVHIETIFIVVNTQCHPGKLLVKSIPRKEQLRQMQRYITDKALPNWVLYRNDLFDQVLSNKQFSVFSVFRDRQVTKGSATAVNGIWVVRSRNIPREGKSIIHIDGYDMYVHRDDMGSFEVTKYLDRDDVFLVPNMTYYPRMIRKPRGVLTNGSVAILIPNEGINVSDADMDYIGSAEFEEFYRIARNHATRSLNIDGVSIYYFCVSE